MTISRTSSVTDLLIEIRRGVHVPLHRQIESSIRDGVRSGRLSLGTALPSSRLLALDLGVSRGVVVEAYEQLVAEGYLTSRAGGYTQVAVGPEPTPAPVPPAPAAAPGIDFRYGRGDATHFPRTAWLRSVRRVLLDTPSDRFGSLTGRGAPELHAALADYLNRARGTSAQPANVVICNGFAQGIALLLQVLADSGARRVVVEDPSSAEDARQIADSAGLEVVGVPVGPEGIEVGALEGLHADAIILTPAHQWPTGAVLSAEARSAVVRWAEAHRALVIEDDYDAEYRYDRAPIGAMQGVAPHLVVYAGTASKTLAPGLRLGWLVLPPVLVDTVARAKLAADRGSAILDQLTFADFLSRGEFDRHLRRMRPIYRRRRDVLLAALGQQLPDFRPTGVSAGFHLVTWLPPDLDEATVVPAADRAGVGVYGISPFRGAHDGDQGLIFGYAGLDDAMIEAGVQALARVVADLRRDRPA
ncbi:MAG: PLP-dependent aminotransferase family protein [Nocardioidaceae bacterium]